MALTLNSSKLPVVTIDGLAGSGKTTLARRLARVLRVPFFSSGILYRGIGLESVKRGLDLSQEAALAEFVNQELLELRVGAVGEIECFVGGRSVHGSELYSSRVSEAASLVAQYASVRTAVLDLQRDLVSVCAANVCAKGETSLGFVLVAEGRDLGTVVYPEAGLKFFVEADSAIRLARRQEQMQRALSEKEKAQELVVRDQRDSQRALAPTQAAHDAILLNNSMASIEDLLVEVVVIARERSVELWEEAC